MVEDNLSLGEELKEWVKDLICDIGPRWAGSPAEARAAERIRGEFEKVCDESYIDSFKAYPRYFENSPHIILGFYVLSLIFYVSSRWLAFGVFAFGAAWYFLDNIFMLKFLDPLFAVKGTVTNVIGKINPSEDTRAILVLSAHHDSPNCYRIWDQDFKGKRYMRLIHITQIIIYSFLGFLLVGALVASFHLLHFWRDLTYIDLLWIPFGIAVAYLWWFCKLFTPYAPSLGANDNLAAVASVIGAGRQLSGNRPRHTQVWLVSFGAEERGFKGSLHFAKKYKSELKDALIVNLDLVGSGEKTMVITKEPYYGATLSAEAVDLILNAAKRAGIDAMPYVMPAGGSDAAALCFHNLKAASIFNLGADMWPPMWHNDTDQPEGLDPNVLENMVHLLEEAVRVTDEGRA